MLLDSFPNATVKAVDISDAMVRVAREQTGSQRASFLCADAEAFIAGKYDLITSNATFHWFRDLACTTENLYKMLDSGGILTFSYFGPNTYRELQESLDLITGSSVIACTSFLTAKEIRDLLGSTFRVSAVEEREYQENFDSLRDLLDNIKLTGTRGVGSGSGVVWTRKLLESLEDTYLWHFGAIRATYQVYMCRAER
jgi:malonyl-CoA O-methyltransferase